jgi:hypothetical protein
MVVWLVGEFQISWYLNWQDIIYGSRVRIINPEEDFKDYHCHFSANQELGNSCIKLRVFFSLGFPHCAGASSTVGY